MGLRDIISFPVAKSAPQLVFLAASAGYIVKVWLGVRPVGRYGGVMDVPFSSISARPNCKRILRALALQSGLLVLAVACASATRLRAQQAASKSDVGSAAASARVEDEQVSPAASRPVPDALKFANGLLRQKKYDLAAEEYERFANSGAQGRDLDDARFGLGTARLYQGNFRESRRAFDEFIKGAPQDPRKLTAQYRLGELAYLLGDLAAARRSLEEFSGATTDHPGLEMALTYLGDTCFGLQDLAPARAAYQRSLAKYPNGRLADRAKYGLGRTLAALGDRKEALAIMQELAKTSKPDWVDRAWLQIGLIRKSNGQLAEAAEAFTTIERVAPRSPLRTEAQLQRALVLLRLERGAEAEPLLQALANDAPAPAGARAALELATIELERKQPDKARSTLESALKRFPDSPLLPALHFRVAEVLEQQNHLEEAQARFERVVEANPNDPWADDALDRAAQTALDRGDLKGARRLAGSFAARFPQSPLRFEVRLIEARAVAHDGKHEDAVAILKSLIDPAARGTKQPAPALSPALEQGARYELALAYRALGKSVLADEILASLAKETSGAVTGNARFLIGQSHLAAGRYRDAVSPLEAYLAANPRGDVADVALAHLAAARLGLMESEEAWKSLATLAERFPRSKALATTRLRLAEAALAAHQAERAAEQFRLVAGIPGSSSEPARSSGAKSTESTESTDPALRLRAVAGLGKALTELGKPADAAAALALALELAPNDRIAPELALALGHALEASKQTDAALKTYSLILEKFAKSDQAPQAALAQARLFAREGRRDLAADVFDRLVGDQHARDSLKAAGVTPDVVLSEFGWVLLDADKVAEADRVFARLLKAYPESPHAADARFNLAESANLAKNHAEVVRLLTPVATMKLAEAEPNHAKNQTAATTVVNDPATADPVRRVLPAALYRLGRTQVELKEWAAAGVTLDRLLADFPDNPYHREARYLRALSALQQGDFKAAEKGFAALLAEPVAPSDPKGMVQAVRLKRIQCWVALKRWKDALEGVQAEKGGLAAGDPAIAELDYVRGQALLGLGRLEDARAAFQAVIDVRKEGELVAQSLLMRGETYFHQDQFHEALRDFLRVDILHDSPPWQSAALLEAGKVYERLDQWADAAETYERLLKKFPTESSAAEARQRLAAANRRAAATPNGRKG
jgi:cellulose synthase operon protein C